jgi:teichoic acid transport system permease protein
MSTVRAVKAGEENEFTTLHHVYEPHKAGLPPVLPYVRELWRRREFAAEASKATMRSANSLTVFGQLWLILNPLLLAAVYYLLVNVIAGGKHRGMDYFAHLTAGLFTFYLVSGSMATGAQSVVAGGKLLMNTSFPRLLLPLSAVRTAFFRFLPTMPIYLIFHLLAGNPIRWATLTALPFLFMLILFSAGLAGFFGALQVYFRDTSAFMPYFVRIWLYLSPVIWLVSDVPKRMAPFVHFNPVYPMLGGFTEALVQGTVPDWQMWVEGTVFCLVFFVVGSLFFMSREREFAVRL